MIAGPFNAGLAFEDQEHIVQKRNQDPNAQPFCLILSS